MLKKIFLLIFTLLFIVSCGDNTTTPTESKGLIEKKYNDFSISIPSSWDIMEDKEKTIPKPSEGDVELAVTSRELKGGFSNNLLILSDKLKTFTTSRNFSILNNVGASDDYLDYTKLDSKEITFLDEEKSILYIFEAKYNLDSPKLKFLQTAHVCNSNKVFLLTIALTTNIKDTTKYEELISTFKCVNNNIDDNSNK